MQVHNSEIAATFYRLAEALEIAGANPFRVRAYKLGVTRIPSLAAGRIDTLPRFGEKIQATIREALSHRTPGPRRWRSALAGEAAGDLIEYLKADSSIEAVEAAGSLRRRRDTVGDLDFVATSHDAEASIRRFVEYPEARKVLSQGPTRSAVTLRSGLQVDIRIVAAESFGAVLLYFTGSKAHNIALRARAQKRGLKTNEYSVFKGRREIPARSEREIYRLLDLPYIEPELRLRRRERNPGHGRGRTPARAL